MICLSLFYEFFKVGLFAVGGGAATIPFLMRMAERLEWFSQAELMNMIAISESTPGPIGINMATYVGYHTAGIPGALIATFALVLPAFIVMVLVASLLMHYKDNRTVKNIFAGIRPAVAGLIASVAVTLIQVTLFVARQGHLHLRVAPAILFALILVAMNLKWCRKLHPVLWIGVGAVAGIILKL